MSTQAYPSRAVWEVAPEVQARDRGLRVAASARWIDLKNAREVARDLGRDGQAVTGDDVRRVLAQRHPEALEGNLNYLGAVWERSVWAPVGFCRSRTVGSHGNRLVRWVLR